MDLLLWRHAEAEDGADDYSRPLTERGRKQAASVAAWLAQHLPSSATQSPPSCLCPACHARLEREKPTPG